MVDVGGAFQYGTAHAAPRRLMEALRLACAAAPIREAEGPATLLPASELGGGPPFWDVVRERRSRRRYTPASISLPGVAALLDASQRFTSTARGTALRAAPSAGALYPLETYLVVNRVRDLDAGLYHYDVPGRRLRLRREGEWGVPLAAAALEQEMCARAAAVFVWTAVFRRSVEKYGPRAYRYVYLDAGHLGHATALAAVAAGLASCQIAAFYDDAVNVLLGVDGVKEAVVYMTSVGAARG